MSNKIKFRKKPILSSKFLSQTQQYWDEIINKRVIMDGLMEKAAQELQEQGYDPDDFIIDRTTMYTFLGSPLQENHSDSFEEGPGFVAFLGSDIIYMQTGIKVDLESAYMVFQLFRLPDYERGNRAWLMLDKGKWKKGPGRDYIDLEGLLEQRKGNEPKGI